MKPRPRCGGTGSLVRLARFRKKAHSDSKVGTSHERVLGREEAVQKGVQPRGYSEAPVLRRPPGKSPQRDTQQGRDEKGKVPIRHSTDRQAALPQREAERTCRVTAMVVTALVVGAPEKRKGGDKNDQRSTRFQYAPPFEEGSSLVNAVLQNVRGDHHVESAVGKAQAPPVHDTDRPNAPGKTGGYRTCAGINTVHVVEAFAPQQEKERAGRASDVENTRGSWKPANKIQDDLPAGSAPPVRVLMAEIVGFVGLVHFFCSRPDGGALVRVTGDASRGGTPAAVKRRGRHRACSLRGSLRFRALGRLVGHSVREGPDVA